MVTIEKENETANARRHVLRLTAAGMAGILSLGGSALPVSAYVNGPAGPESAGFEDDSVQAEDSGAEEVAGEEAGVPDEDRILRSWHLDPDAFPSLEDGKIPEAPEELLPYFEELTQEAVLRYAGEAPAEADLSPYSPRADAIRAAVRTAAGQAAEKDKKDILEKLQAAGSALDGNRFGKLLASLQKTGAPASSALGGRPAAEESPAVNAFAEQRETGEENSVEEGDSSFHPGLPSLQTYLRERQAAAGGDKAAGGFDGTAAQQRPDRLPVPPALYDFSIHFPAAADKMQTPGGWTLFPGLAHYIGFTDPVHQVVLQDSLVDRDRSLREREEREEEAAAALPDAVPFSQNASLAEGTGSEGIGTGDAGSEYADAEGTGSEDTEIEDTEIEDTEIEDTDSEDTGFGTASFGSTAYDSLLEKVPFAQTSVRPERRTLFIGDSRTVGMKIYVGGEENEYWSAKNSMGYSWMVSSGVPAVEDLIGRDTDVVILMGVNDIGNMESYVDYMNEKAAEWKRRGARTFFVSVTPVRENSSHNAKNSRIDEFNAYAQANLRGVHYIDAADRIRDSFGSPDGLHYDGPTYREIYEIIHFYLYRGWYERDGLRFWFDCGRPLTGWQFLDGQWQYMDGLGVRWVTDGRVGDVCLAPFPDTGLLDPYKAVVEPRGRSLDR